jgi:hypothetical protein
VWLVSRASSLALPIFVKIEKKNALTCGEKSQNSEEQGVHDALTQPNSGLEVVGYIRKNSASKDIDQL